MIKRLTGEFLGTFSLVFCGTGAIIIDQETGGTITHAGIALTFGMIVLAMILAFGHVSGAHINPAVSIGLWMARRFQGRHVIPFIMVQIAGGCTASLILRGLFPKNKYLGSTLPAGNDSQSFILESILTCILMLVILTSADKKDHSLIGPALAIGSTVGLEAMFAGPICGASMNPARSIGPAIASGHFQALWVYIAAPVLGALAAVPLFSIVRHRE
jgi:aquaporin NIP